MYEIEYLEGPFSEAAQGTVLRLYEAVFGAPPDASALDRLEKQSGWLLVLALDANQQAVGFKLGYRDDPETFYSWLGGVLPEARGHKLGHRMMTAQHDWCRAKGYRKIRTNTLNQWRKMLILNLNSGFDIIGTEPGSRGLKILMMKELT
jgi:GNAT superfamily N-acetyltransferase